MDKNKYWEVFSTYSGRKVTADEAQAIADFLARTKNDWENGHVSITESRVLGIFKDGCLWAAPEAVKRLGSSCL